MMVAQVDAFQSEPCFDLLVLQENIKKNNTVEFEKVFFFHSYAQAIGDVYYPEEEPSARFLSGMGVIAKACMDNPTAPLSVVMSESVK